MNRLAISKKEAAMQLAFAAGIAGLDQMIKFFVGKAERGSVIAEFPPLFDLMRTENSGAAFSIFSGKTLFLLGATTLMLAALLWTILLYPAISRKARWTFSALLGGGVGNWIDRIGRRMVSDYIRLRFIDFPVFNLADIFITLSVAGLILLLLTGQFESNHTGEVHGTGH